MKNVNKKVLKVVERLMRNEAVQSAGKFPYQLDASSRNGKIGLSASGIL